MVPIYFVYPQIVKTDKGSINHSNTEEKKIESIFQRTNYSI